MGSSASPPSQHCGNAESCPELSLAAAHTWALKPPILIFFFPKNPCVNKKSIDANNEQLWVQRSHRWS